jgi:hypothetical protein
VLESIISALETRRKAVGKERQKDASKRETIEPTLSNVSGLLLQAIEKSASAQQTPEAAYASLRKNIIDIQQEIAGNIQTMKNSELHWGGRDAELRDILSDLRKLSAVSLETPTKPRHNPQPSPPAPERKIVDTSPPPEPTVEPPPEPSPSLTKKERPIGRRPRGKS